VVQDVYLLLLQELKGLRCKSYNCVPVLVAVPMFFIYLLMKLKNSSGAKNVTTSASDLTFARIDCWSASNGWCFSLPCRTQRKSFFVLNTCCRYNFPDSLLREVAADGVASPAPHVTSASDVEASRNNALGLNDAACDVVRSVEVR